MCCPTINGHHITCHFKGFQLRLCDMAKMLYLNIFNRYLDHTSIIIKGSVKTEGFFLLKKQKQATNPKRCAKYR